MTLKEKLTQIQFELKAPKNLRNNFGGYNYRNAESILEALKPLQIKYKVTTVLDDDIIHVAGRIYVKSVATLCDDETEERITAVAYAREAESKKGMDDAQVTGATSSYSRKYALNGLFLLDDTKDVDTEEYQAQAKQEPKKAMPKPKAKPEPKKAPVQATGARAELREFIHLNGLDGHKIAEMCNLGPNSTEEDYQGALEYAKSLMEGPAEE